MENQNVAIKLKNFRFAESELNEALEELEKAYYHMDDDNPYIEEILECLQKYGLIPRDELDIESELVKEYEIAKKENASEEKIKEICNKMKVTNRRFFNNCTEDILYALLQDENYE